MMKTFTTIVLLFATLVLFQSCDKDDEYTPQPLPYFFCKINGQNFSRRPSLPCQSMVFNYYPNGYMQIPQGALSLSGTDCINYDAVAIGLFGAGHSLNYLNLRDTTVLDSSSAFFSTYSIGDEYVKFDSLISGYVNFSAFSDRNTDQNGVVSGTFEFTVKNEELDSTVIITEGSFQYIIDYEWY